jgi:hypothetical protein
MLDGILSQSDTAACCDRDDDIALLTAPRGHDERHGRGQHIIDRAVHLPLLVSVDEAAKYMDL